MERYIEAVVCTECFVVAPRHSRNPCNPCLDCGGKVIDGFSVQETVSESFWNKYWHGRTVLLMHTFRRIDPEKPFGAPMCIVENVKRKYNVRS